MKRETFEIFDKEKWLKLRSQDITSTEAAALFGLSPYMTVFELWHLKKSGDIVSIEENERMKWGSRLEATIAEGIAEDNGWQVSPFKEYMRLTDLKMGSSFDYKIEDNGILEIKNVDSLVFNNKWIVDEAITEAPAHIELQVQHQLAVSDLEYAYIGALVGGNTVHLIKRTRSEKIITNLKNKVEEFWNSIEANKPPAPDFEKDASFIACLYPDGSGEAMDATGEIEELAFKYKQAAEAEKEAKKQKAAVKAQVLTLIGDAAKVTSDKFTLSAGNVKASSYTVEREAYRNFRITWKKVKDGK